MKRYNPIVGSEIEVPAIDAFLKEIVEVCKRHGMSISHEETHDAFIVAPFEQELATWLLSAHDGTDARKRRQLCGERGVEYSCTEPKEHDGEHASRTASDELLARWHS